MYTYIFVSIPVRIREFCRRIVTAQYGMNKSSSTGSGYFSIGGYFSIVDLLSERFKISYFKYHIQFEGTQTTLYVLRHGQIMALTPGFHLRGAILTTIKCKKSVIFFLKKFYLHDHLWNFQAHSIFGLVYADGNYM